MRNDIHCPYLDDDCPKVSDLDEQVKALRKTQMEMYRLLYIIVGICTVTFGVSLI